MTTKEMDEQEGPAKVGYQLFDWVRIELWDGKVEAFRIDELRRYRGSNTLTIVARKFDANWPHSNGRYSIPTEWVGDDNSVTLPKLAILELNNLPTIKPLETKFASGCCAGVVNLAPMLDLEEQDSLVKPPSDRVEAF